MLTLRFHNGYWTAFSGDQAIMTFASFERAIEVLS
jgi:hypothetical protein